MTMRKYIVTIHEDGHITADEYEEPKGFVYCSGDASSVRDAYNRALIDVIAVLEAEKALCDANSKICRSIECELLKTEIQKLFRKS